MRFSTAFVLLSLLLTPGSAQQMYRRGKTPFDAVSLTARQRRKIDTLTASYNPRLQALRQRDKNGKDVFEERDALNREYSKALLALMSPSQKTAYLEAVYRHVQNFLSTHKGVKFEDVFVWGGALAKKPASHV